MLDVLCRESVYIWYYFSIQLEQIFRYWIFGMVTGSVISVFGKIKYISCLTVCGMTGCFYDGIYPPESAAYDLQCGAWREAVLQFFRFRRPA